MRFPCVAEKQVLPNPIAEIHRNFVFTVDQTDWPIQIVAFRDQRDECTGLAPVRCC
jgi:hypothetical protein